MASPLAVDIAQALKDLMSSTDYWIAMEKAREQAAIRASSDQRPRLMLRLPIKLDTATTTSNPALISNPFDSFFVDAAQTDQTATVNLFTGLDNTQDYTVLGQNSSGKLSKPTRNAMLTWASQPGLTLTVVFFLGIDFRPGNSLVTLQGGVTLSTGTTMGNPVEVSLVAGTASIIFPANASRNTANGYNNTGGKIWIGGSLVANTGSFTGIPYGDQERLLCTNKGAVYAMPESSGKFYYVEES